MKPKVAKLETLTGDLTDLRAFCRVADLSSITAAARTLGESKGSVSRRISRLEHAVGVRLLRRNSRNTALTEEGFTFRSSVASALELLDAGVSQLNHTQTTPRGVLRLTAPSDLSAWLAKHIAGFVRKYPEVQIEGILTQTQLDFDANQLDIAIRAGTHLPDSSLIAQKLFSMSAILFAAPSYISQYGMPKHPSEIHQHRLFSMRFPRVQRVLLAIPDDPNSTIELPMQNTHYVNDGEFLRQIALSGEAISLLAPLVANSDLQQGKLVRVLEPYETVLKGQLYMLYSSNPLLSPKVRAFRDFMLEQCRLSPG